MNNICFYDVETTGVVAKGLEWDKDFMYFPKVVQLSWCMNGVEKDYIIQPEGWEIPPEVVAIHGISTERAHKEGVPFASIVDEFIEDCEHAHLLIGHNIYFDTSILKAMVLHIMGREYYDSKVDSALYKGKRIDTMYKTIKFVGAKKANGAGGKFPSLVELYAKVFDGATFPAHNSLEDVRALVRCVPFLVDNGLIELVQKQYEPKQLKLQPVKETRVEFVDNPVVMPDSLQEEPQPFVPGIEKNIANELLNDLDI